MRLKVSEIVKAAGGTLLCGQEDTVVTSFATDSREVKSGVMFVPIRGEKTDGHRYIETAFDSGGAASFTEEDIRTEQKVTWENRPLVLVDDCRAALQKTAAWYRSQFDIPVVGITGSVGKTTAKEMVAQALSAAGNVHKTAGNQNSQVGVPITVCGLKKEHTAAVVEMGVSMPGEMERIAAVVKPTCAVMTNIGVSHIEFMKTRENILTEKAHIADYLPEDGALFVNGDDDLLPGLKKTCPHKVVTFGVDFPCDWTASDLREADGGTFFTCTGPGGEHQKLFVPAAGRHNVRNALAAFAVARYLKVPAEDAARAIGAYKAPAMRQQIFDCGGLTLIDDSYNASPDSMRSAIDVLTTRGNPGKTVAVLADMLELGDFAAKGHFEVGTYAREKGVDLLVAVGELAKEIAAGYGQSALWFADNGEASTFLKETLQPGDAVLVKGSRSMKTDEIVASLKEKFS
ncbi:MAG: UDP-N-acetylmuramoyl-tripeptide--D-alanyl-D-alanine ligase [Acutalibacter sp.]|nr:UDP-N-acetylmuramoyl-tripeptide--D-alanyl-D-alanine ligase [Acutalibacter sp.]